MKRRFIIALLIQLTTLPAWADSQDMGISGARHLLSRTGFGANPATIKVYSHLDRETAVDRILAGTQTSAITPPPGWVDSPFDKPNQSQFTEEQKKALQKERNDHAVELRCWWLSEMRNTPSPLTEKMTLFWHNHFVSALEKVNNPQMMYQQNVLLRHYAVGNFGELLHQIAKDPAMMRYLDTANNRKTQPNENFAREVMELFTLGEGHYTEQDIREAARAFTGWGVDHDGQFINRYNQHDTGDKTIYGEHGRFDGDDVLNLILARPETATFITTKLWKYLVSPTPDAVTINKLATVFRQNHYEMKPLLRAMLLTPAFWKSQGQLVKSPLELTIGTLVTFDMQPSDWRQLVNLNRQLGQDVFNPPNVKGWPGGEQWINSTTLLTRKQFLDRIIRDAMPIRNTYLLPDGQFDENKSRQARINRLAKSGLTQTKLQPDEWAAMYHVAQAQDASRLLLALPPSHPLPDSINGTQAIAQLLLDPAYQVE